MTQPRKHQVKDLKTKSTQIDTAGTDQLGGAIVQNLVNTGFSSAYDDFLAQSITEILDGADESAPPILYGGFGPFVAITSGDSFTIIIPSVNSGNPIGIVVQPTDIVIISGNPVLTTSRAVDLINRNLALFGVSTPVAENVNGQLVLIGADTSGRIYGDSSFITITDVTIGILIDLGFLASPSTANGATAPRRGLVTLSQDGLGGYVALRKEDRSPATTFNSALLTFPVPGGYLLHIEETLPGQQIYARLRQFPGPDLNGKRFELSYFQDGQLRPRLVTSKSDFSSLTGADTITINISDPSHFVNENVVVNFAVPPTTPQDVVDAVQLQWNNITFSDTGYYAGAAAVTLTIPGPYSFGSGESFFISFQTTAVIHIEPNSSVVPEIVTAADLAAFIQAAIIAAGAGAQGQAFTVTDPVTNNQKVVIQSLNQSGFGSEVVIYPGNLSGPTPADFMNTLDKVGLVPGKFKGSSIALLYGSDEIAFINPSHSESASITISGLAPSMARLGFGSAVVSNTSAFGMEPTMAPLVQTLIPEVMEFGEVPNGLDITIQQFLSPDNHPIVNPIGGLSNFGASPVIGPNGQVVSTIVPKQVPFLSADQVVLGAQLTGSVAAQAQARVTIPFDASNGPVLIWESTTVQGNAEIRTRCYKTTEDVMIETWNATFDGLNYLKDDDALYSFRIVTWQGAKGYEYRDPGAGPWLDPDWTKPIITYPFDIPIGAFPHTPFPLISLGDQSLKETLAQTIYVPRLQITLPNAQPVLAMQGLNFSAFAPNPRTYYISNSAGGSFSTDTVNAWQDTAGQWNKDLPGTGAAATLLSDDFGFGPTFAVFLQQDTSNAPWVGWSVTPYFTFAESTLPTGAWNVMLSPLKTQSVRRALPVPINSIVGANVNIVCSETVPTDTFIFFMNGNIIDSIDMHSFLLMTTGDEFEIVFMNFIGAAQINIAGPLAVWGPGIAWENPLDGWLSGVATGVDRYHFKQLGASASLAPFLGGGRLLLGSVTRYTI